MYRASPFRCVFTIRSVPLLQEKAPMGRHVVPVALFKNCERYSMCLMDVRDAMWTLFRLRAHSFALQPLIYGWPADPYIDSHAYSPLLGSKCGFRRGFWHGIELPRLKTFRVFGPSSIYFCCLVCCLPLLGFVRCHQRMTAGGHSLPSFHRFGQESVCPSMLLSWLVSSSCSSVVQP